MARIIAIIIFSVLVGTLLGVVGTHLHHKNLWRKQFSEKKAASLQKGRGDDFRSDRLPPELMERIGMDLLLPDAKLASKVEAFPFYQNLSLEERAKFMEKLGRVRKRQLEIVNRKIDDYHLQLNEEQTQAFQKAVLQKRFTNMKAMRARSQEILSELEKKSDEELLKEFSGVKNP